MGVKKGGRQSTGTALCKNPNEIRYGYSVVSKAPGIYGAAAAVERNFSDAGNNTTAERSLLLENSRASDVWRIEQKQSKLNDIWSRSWWPLCKAGMIQTICARQAAMLFQLRRILYPNTWKDSIVKKAIASTTAFGSACGARHYPSTLAYPRLGM
jgi:hypothetical protein